MMARRSILISLLLMVVLPGICFAGTMPFWRLELKETATVQGGIVKLADLTTGPLPAGMGDLVMVAGGQPGTMKAISRRMILRKLVTEGMSSGVSFTGPEWSQIVFEGSESTVEKLRPRIRGLIQPMVPTGSLGAPSPWFELELPDASFPFQNDISLSCSEVDPLTPGRNTLRIRLHDGTHHRDFQIIVNLHVSGEVGTALVDVPREQSLNPDDFRWQWRDLSNVGQGLVVGRDILLASSAARNIKVGQILRTADLKNTPVILAGDRVDICINRGNLEVVVKGLARQAGSLGQVIPVRNILNGRLVNATVSGPGIVQWRN